jgi:phage gpG-like protein
MIRISIDDQEVLSALRRLAQSPAKMRPVMKMIGEEMTESTKRRFETSIGPDGKRWKALAQSTVLARLSKVKGVGAEVHQFGTRDGRIPARPFLGLSNSDKTTLLDSLASFLKEQVKP